MGLPSAAPVTHNRRRPDWLGGRIHFRIHTSHARRVPALALALLALACAPVLAQPAAAADSRDAVARDASGPGMLPAPPDAATPPGAIHPRGGMGPPQDPVVSLVRRMRHYFEHHELDGVTLDARYPVNPSETIRMSVVCQVLAYCELERAHPSARLRAEIVRHTDYLLPRLDQVRSGTPFDGMLGDCLLEAYERTHLPRYLAAGQILEDELEAIPTSECILNGGLMVAMATAEYARLTGGATATQKTHAILAQLDPYQNGDGSFPHWCWGTEDIHYTGWMGQELILIGRRIADPVIDPTLARMDAFLSGRMSPDGQARYEEPCSAYPDCIVAYYSRGSGCGIDYDTRALTVEPGYEALVFDHFHEPMLAPVMGFMRTLEHGGTFADKWAYISPPSDPQHVWEIADTSVVNMSIILWSMATILSGRPHHADDAVDPTDPALDAQPTDAPAPVVALPAGVAAPLWSEADRRFMAGMSPGGPPATAPPAPRPRQDSDAALAAGAPRTGASGLTVIAPNPAAPGTRIAFALARAGAVRLELCDIAGRRVRTLLAAALPAGAHAVRWDGRDALGRAVPGGVYVVRLDADGVVTGRLLFVP